MIVIYDQSFTATYSLLFDLIKKIEPLLLSSIFFLFCFSTVSSTMNAELHATTVHFVRHIQYKLFPAMTDKQLYRASYQFSGILLFALLLISFFFNIDALEFLFFFGTLYAAMIPVMLFITLSKRKLSALLPYAVPIGAIGVHLLPSNDPLDLIWYSFLLSLLVSVGSMLFAPRELR